MKSYRIENKKSGADYGVWQGESESAAFAALATEGGGVVCDRDDESVDWHMRMDIRDWTITEVKTLYLAATDEVYVDPFASEDNRAGEYDLAREYIRLVEAGLIDLPWVKSVERVRGYHVWNGKRAQFRYQHGGVGSYSALSASERADIERVMDAAEEETRGEG